MCSRESRIRGHIESAGGKNVRHDLLYAIPCIPGSERALFDAYFDRQRPAVLGYEGVTGFYVFDAAKDGVDVDKPQRCPARRAPNGDAVEAQRVQRRSLRVPVELILLAAKRHSRRPED